MSLFSFLGRKKKQESAAEAPDFTSRSAEESQAYRSNNRSTKGASGAAKAPAEADLPEKKRARRRLVGAIALVLAAIIGLPMLFDSEQKSVPDDIAIQIPSVDAPTAVGPAAPALPKAPAGVSSAGAVSAASGLSQQEEIITPAPAAKVPPAPVAPIVAPAPVASGLIVPAEQELKPEPKVEHRPEPKAEPQPEPRAEPRHEPKPESKHEPKSRPEPKPEPKSEPKPEPKQSIRTDDAARAKAILEGRAESVAPEKSASKFTLQIAALATQEKVDELQGRLKDAGIHSYTQKVSTQSGARIRIRVGSFSSREEADKMHAKLVKLGFGGSVVPVN